MFWNGIHEQILLWSPCVENRYTLPCVILCCISYTNTIHIRFSFDSFHQCQFAKPSKEDRFRCSGKLYALLLIVGLKTENPMLLACKHMTERSFADSSFFIAAKWGHLGNAFFLHPMKFLSVLPQWQSRLLAKSRPIKRSDILKSCITGFLKINHPILISTKNKISLRVKTGWSERAAEPNRRRNKSLASPKVW